MAGARHGSPAGLESEIADVDWWHSIDLGDGLVTPGFKTPAWLADELTRLRLPTLAGRTVLDVGAWDGYYAFHAERAGAARVVALDHYAWGARIRDFAPAWEDRRADGPTAFVLEDDPRWDPIGLPGRAGFDLARRALSSGVETAVLDVARDDLEPLGRFDVILFLGVLYHLRDPLRALRRLAAICDGVTVVETEAVAIGGHPDAAAVEFLGTEDRKLHGDPTNWWIPTPAGLVALCERAGFARVELIGAPPVPRRGERSRYRAVAHAWR